RKFLGSLGLFPNTGVAAPGRVEGAQAIEYVIQRAGSQMGVPYSWGGGSLNGPTTGVDDGAGTVGGDCSGLMRYAFAGVGLLILCFSGDQYNAGRHIPRSQAKRGDLILYGPGGSQHVTMFLGNGQMLEASSLAGKVTVSPVRTPGMTPYLTRIIESCRAAKAVPAEPTSTEFRTPGIVDEDTPLSTALEDLIHEFTRWAATGPRRFFGPGRGTRPPGWAGHPGRQSTA